MEQAPANRFSSPTQLPLAIAPSQSELQKHYAFLWEFLKKRWKGTDINEYLDGRATAAVRFLGNAWNSPPPGPLPESAPEIPPWLEWLAAQQALAPNGNEVISFLAECVRRSDTNWIESIPPHSGSNLAPQSLNALRNRGITVPSHLTARGNGVLCFGVPFQNSNDKKYRTVYWTIALNVAENGEVPLPNPPDLLFNVGAFFDSNGDPVTFLSREDLEGFFDAPWPLESLGDWPAFLAELEKRWRDLSGSRLAETPLLFGSHVRNMCVELIVREDDIPSPLPKLYGMLERMPELPPLTALVIKGDSPAPVRLASAPRHLFLGHMDQAGEGAESSAISDRKGFPLDLTQRLAATYAAAFGRGEDPAILPVNGPPGTGKTSFLRAVLASYWVREAYHEAATPMLVVATGATNKAVSNVIEAFSGVCERVPGALQTRWIDGVPSYGWFNPSQNAAKLFPDLMHLSIFKGTLTRSGAAGDLESALTGNLPGLVEKYLVQARIYFKKPDLVLPRTVQLLHGRIVAQVDAMRADQAAFRQLLDSIAGCYGKTKSARPFLLVTLRAEQQALAGELQEIQIELARGQQVIEKFARYLEARAREVRGIRKFFPRRLRNFFWKEEVLHTASCLCSLNQALDAFGRPPLGDFETPELKLSELTAAVSGIRADFSGREQAHQSLSRQEAVAVGHRDAWRTLANSTVSLTRSTGRPGLERSTIHYLLRLARNPEDSRAEDFLWHRFDAAQDVDYRFPLFHLAARYWEGRWLVAEQAAAEQKHPSRENLLRRCAMLGVVTVATTHKLPGLLDFQEIADVLVIDETGQCLPEVGVAMSSLARHLLAVGDCRQLQPIWACDRVATKHIAARTLGYPPPAELSPSEGSMMLAAQRAAGFHDGGDAPGITLLYHYRCHPHIIGYCNELLYGGKILPFRGAALRPSCSPITWVDVRGTPYRKGISWANEAEALEIASWLESEHERLCAEYGGSLDKVVAVLAPLGAQATLLKSVLKRRLAPVVGEEVVERMTIGTVHSLQGAERPVVAFSLVQSTARGNPTLFANTGNGNLLNVAVSRAREQFIIFGDRECLRPAPSDPPSRERLPVDLLGGYLRRFGARLYPRQLVIIEAPGKAARLSRTLGKSVAVVATVGNLRTSSLKDGALEWSEPPKEFCRLLSPHAGLVSTVIIATDDDIAGELIGYHAAEVAASILGPEIQVKRMRFHSTDAAELSTSFKVAGPRFDVGLLRAALVRETLRHADKNEYAEKLPSLPYQSAQRREVLATLETEAGGKLNKVLLRLDPVGREGAPASAQLVQSSAAAGCPVNLAEDTDFDGVKAALLGAEIDMTTMRSVTQQAPPYPASTTSEILGRISDELGVPPWEAQQHLNALYQEGADDSR